MVLMKSSETGTSLTVRAQDRGLNSPAMSRIQKRSIRAANRPVSRVYPYNLKVLTTVQNTAPPTRGSRYLRECFVLFTAKRPGGWKSWKMNSDSISNSSMTLRPPVHDTDGDGHADEAGYDYVPDGGVEQSVARVLLGHRDDLKLSPEPPHPPRSSSRHYSAEDSSETPNIAEQAFARPAVAGMALPDPSQFPDPYPFRPPHHHFNSMPALSNSGGSTSNSTRSSAYASSGSNAASGDYNNVHIASSDEYVAITPDSVSQYLAKEPAAVPTARINQSRAPVDHSRWSGAYSSSARSRSSSINNGSSAPHDSSPIPNVPSLAQKQSYDLSWQAVDERDEAGIISEDETDDEHLIGDGDSGMVDREEERTSAAVVAEEGRGLIVQASNTPIVQLQVQTGESYHHLDSTALSN